MADHPRAVRRPRHLLNEGIDGLHHPTDLTGHRAVTPAKGTLSPIMLLLGLAAAVAWAVAAALGGVGYS